MADTNLAKIQSGERGLQLHNLEDMRTASQLILQSGMCPDGYKTAPQVFVGLQTGAEIGLKPMQALNSIAVIHGRPTLWGDSALGMVRRSGLLTAFSEEVTGTGDNMVAKVVSTREDKFTVTSEFSAQDAKKARLWDKKGPWQTHPKRMLKYKARAFNLRDNFSDILMGMHLTEEMIGEVEEPMASPKCDVPQRADRRKKVENISSPDKPVESSAMDSAGVGDEIIEPEPIVRAEQAEETEVVTEDTSALYGDLLDLFQVKILKEDYLDEDDIKAGFTEWAAEILCRDEDEIDSPEKFTVAMLNQLKVALEQGV